MKHYETPEEIFESLVAIDPTIQDNKASIMKAIEKLLQEKPETNFNEEFARTLKAELLAESVPSKKPFEKALSWIRANITKRVVFAGSGILAATIAIFAGWYVYDMRTGVPEVLAGNWDFSYHKIPYDVPSLDVTFSRDLAASSVNMANVHLYPNVSGDVTLKGTNTVSYKLSEKLVIGKRYLLEITPEVSSQYGVKIGKVIRFEFEAVAGAKASRILPNGTGAIDDLSKHVLVFFNIPVIPLTSLKNKDTLPCPIEITPKIEGDCKWTTSSVLEFIPKHGLEAATKYSIKTTNPSGLLYPLSESVESSFETTPLAASFDATQTFSPKSGFPLRFSADVRTTDLAGFVTIANAAKEKIPLSFTEVKNNPVGRVFWVNPANGAFDYGTQYALAIAPALPSARGNVPAVAGTGAAITSVKFLSAVESYVRVYSDTGALIDTRLIYNSSNLVPYVALKNSELRLHFDEEVPLVPGSVKLAWEGGEKECALAYSKKEIDNPKEPGTMQTVDDKNQLICTLDGELPAAAKSAKIVASKNLSSSLKADAVQEVVFPEKLSIDANAILKSNTELCVYTNNELSFFDESNGTSGFQTEPKSLIRGVNPGGNQYSVTPVCPLRAGRIGYVVGVRLNPNSTYTLSATTKLADMYGGTLASPVSFGAMKSGAMQPKDRYLYSSVTRDVNVIPSNVPVVLGLQSINIESAKIEVCEMDVSGYMDYKTRQYEIYYEPKCVTKTDSQVPLKNRFWEISPTQVDVEKDILHRAITTPFVLVRGSSMDRFHLNETPGYNDSDREFANLYIRSNLSLTYEKAGTGKSYVFATSFDGKDLPSNLTFETYNSSGTPDFRATWNAAKKLYEASGAADVIIAKSDRYFGVITPDSDQFSNYDFSYVSGQDSSTKDYAYVYTDRPIYRPGDEVHLKGLLRTFNVRGYEKTKSASVKLRILDETSTLFKEVSAKLDANSNFTLDFNLPWDVKVGRYSFELYSEKTPTESVYIYNDGFFHVESYRKPVFRAGVGIDKKEATLGDKANIMVTPTYYFGGNLANTDYQYSVHSQSYFVDAKEYSDYQFGSGYERFSCLYWGYCNYRDSVEYTGSGHIGANGAGKFEYQFSRDDQNKAEKIYTFNVDVVDPDTGRTVSDSVSTVLHVTDGYAGLKVPYWTDKNAPIAVDGVLIGTDSKGKKGAVRLEFWKREWKDVKKQGVDGIFYHDYVLDEQKEGEQSVDANAKGVWKASYTPKSSGEYEVRAIYTGANGASYTSSSSAYVASENYVTWNNGNNSTTELVAEKTLLKVGDTARFTLKSPVKSGKYFIAIEKDDAILDTQVRDISSYGEKIEFPITEAAIPNIYVKAFLIGSEEKALLPTYKRALGVVKVSTDPKKLSVEVRSDRKNYLPGQKVNLAIFVKDASGNPVAGANGSISIVDESVLALLGNPKKNPFGFFYDMKRYLGVETMASLARLIEKLEIKNVGNGEKGGAGEGQKGGNSKKKRGVFKDTAFWKSDFTTDKDGKFLITTDELPDNLTTWSIESIVSTADNRIGIGETSILSTKNVVISENLPRFLVSGDTMTLSPVVFNKTGKDSDIEVTLSGSNIAIKKPTQTVFLKNGESRSVEFEVVPNRGNISGFNPFFSTLNITAVARASGEQDELERTLPIQADLIPETTTTVGQTRDVSFDERLDLAGFDKSNGLLTLHYGATPLSFLTDGMSYLAQYPYGCVEQRTSVIVPNIAQKKLYDAAGIPFDLNTKKVSQYVDAETGYKEVSLLETFENYLVSLTDFQRADGGFGYWKDSAASDFRLTAYAIQTTADLISLQLRADPKVLSNAVAYLKERFFARSEPCGYGCNRKYSEGERLSAVLAVLSVRSDDADGLKMWNSIDISKLSTEERVLSLSVISKLLNSSSVLEAMKADLKKQANTTVTKILSERLVFDPRGSYLSNETSVSEVKLTASFLESIALLGKHIDRVPDDATSNMLRFLARAKKSDGSFGSTEETASVVRSIAGYLAATPDISHVKMVAKIGLNETKLDEKNIDGKDMFASFSKEVSTKDLSDNSTLHFEKQWSGTLFYDATLRIGVPSASAQSRDEGLFVDTKYYDYNEYLAIKAKKSEEWAAYLSGSIAYEALKYPNAAAEYLTPVTQLKVGQLVYVRTRILTPESKTRLAFESPIPSGSELVNNRLSTEKKTDRDELFFGREEMRDDRYFGYSDWIDAGEYIGSYVLRVTHAGTFSVAPSIAYEFDTPEVFGRTEGKKITVKK